MTERICSVRGCITKLATYNPGKTCFVHTERSPVTGRGFVEMPFKRDRLSKEEKARYASGDWLG